MVAAKHDVRLRGWNGAQAQRAVQSLLKHIGAQQNASNSLLGEEDEVRLARWLGFFCRRPPPPKRCQMQAGRTITGRTAGF
jgi:hypothetical protein